jgi:hypothetical protein
MLFTHLHGNYGDKRRGISGNVQVVRFTDISTVTGHGTVQESDQSLYYRDKMQHIQSNIGFIQRGYAQTQETAVCLNTRIVRELGSTD